MLRIKKNLIINTVTDFPDSPACAPSILITFINMVLFKNAEALPNCNTVYMFAGQVIINYVFW